MAKGVRYTEEFREKALRLLEGSRTNRSSETRAVASVSSVLGIAPGDAASVAEQGGSGGGWGFLPGRGGGCRRAQAPALRGDARQVVLPRACARQALIAAHAHQQVHGVLADRRVHETGGATRNARGRPRRTPCSGGPRRPRARSRSATRPRANPSAHAAAGPGPDPACRGRAAHGHRTRWTHYQAARFSSFSRSHTE